MEGEEEKLEEQESILYNKVKLKRKWTFWENYQTREKSKEEDYSKLTQSIYSFDTIIEFWQFWNNYQGSDPKNIFFDGERIKYFFEDKKRIIAMNLFEDGIRPEWEDEKNNNGYVFTMDYLVDKDLENFYETAPIYWNKLILSLIGETALNCEFINGIRFVDKSNLGKKAILRFEIWFNSNIPEDEISKTKEFYGKEFGCSGIFVKTIKVPVKGGK